MKCQILFDEVLYTRSDLIGADAALVTFSVVDSGIYFQDAAVADIYNFHLIIDSILTVTEQLFKFTLHNISETVRGKI